MATATATYPNGGFRTDVSGIPGTDLAGPAGAGMDLGWLLDLARRRAQQKLAMGDLELKSATRAYRGGGVMSPDERARRMAMVNAGQRDVAATQAAQAEADAASRPAPVTWSPGWTVNGPGFWSTDPRMMSGAQRARFLPQNSQLTGGPTTSEIGAGERAATAGRAAGGFDALGSSNRFTAINPAPVQESGIDDYLRSLRMYQPTMFKSLAMGGR